MNVQERLRALVEAIRRKPFPISDIIPLLNEAADELDKNQIELEGNRDQLNWLSCLEAAGVDNWEGIEEAQRMYREDEE